VKDDGLDRYGHLPLLPLNQCRSQRRIDKFTGLIRFAQLGTCGKLTSNSFNRLGRSERLGPGQGTADVPVGTEARERVDLHPDRERLPARQSRPYPARTDRVQVGSYVGEDDIVRLDDVYGRS
jgi:hypothetical protein